MPTYYVQRKTVSEVLYREGCYIEAENPSQAKELAKEEGDWETEKEIECLGSTPIDSSYIVDSL